MGFAVFVHRADSIYDDRPDQRYQFPRQYLSRVEAAVGDWIVYYEPTKVERSRGYFAVARVQRVIPDPTAAGMFVALIAPGTYLPFPREVPFNLPGGPAEAGLLNEAGRLSGRAQSAVRQLSPTDFNRIVALGLDESDAVLPRLGALTPDTAPTAFNEEQVPFGDELARERVMQLISRPLRDRVFRTIVVRAYEQRCAVTGLRLLNGGGRAEVDAAHIQPVQANGPDDVRNGVALSGTAHWMFDRGLIAVQDDFAIVISRQVNDRESVEGLVNPTRRLIVPTDPLLRPHPRYLSWHRENVFKT